MNKVITKELVDAVLDVLADGYVQVWPSEEIDSEEVAAQVNFNLTMSKLYALHDLDVRVLFPDGESVYGDLVYDWETGVHSVKAGDNAVVFDKAAIEEIVGHTITLAY